MRSVKVDKDKLLGTLRTNAETHKQDFEIAFAAFQEKVIENVEARLASWKAGNEVTQEALWINMEVPEDHSEDYERAIEMLAWEVGDEVVLQEQEFREYVQDKWTWKGKFATDNQFYTGHVSPSSIR
jgi:RNA-splicing ligase RtcB